MITLEQPAVSLNSSDVPGPHYAMWRTVDMPEGISPTQVVNEIVTAHKLALTSKKSPLVNTVINCHGYDNGGGLITGGHGKPGITQTNVSVFGVLKPLNIGPIWLVACQVARTSNGIAFCQAVANAAGTVVIAGEDDQELTTWQTLRYYIGPSGRIDEYEGIVYIFYPNNTYVKGIDPEDYVWTVKV